MFGLSQIFRGLTLYCLIASAQADHHMILNHTCVGEQLDLLAETSERQFNKVFQTPILRDAWIDNTPAYHEVQIQTLWAMNNLQKMSVELYRDTLQVDQNNDVFARTGMVHLNNAILYDRFDENLTAMITMENDEEYLTVETDNSRTTCTLRLSAYNVHGSVMRSAPFAKFRFSPDGQQIMYMAEAMRPSLLQYLYLGDFWAYPRVTRPTIILYEIDNLRFKTLANFPVHLTPGDVHWHPIDTNKLVGVVWENQPFPRMYPLSSNVPSRLFLYDLALDTFAFITSDDLHVDTPRFSPDGTKLVYLENSLFSSTVPRLDPGPYMSASRVVMMLWSSVESLAGRQSNDLAPDAMSIVLVDNPQNGSPLPEILPDGTTFYGIYPYRDPTYGAPSRIFSSDGSLIYMTVYQLDATHVIVVDVNTQQITIHPEKSQVMLDIFDDVMLVRGEDISQRPTLRVGRFHDDYWTTVSTQSPPTTERTTTTTTTTTTTPTTTTAAPETTTTPLDPCEHLLQEYEGLNTNFTVIDASDLTTTTETASSTTPTPIETTTAMSTTPNPQAIPLRLARVHFEDLSPSSNLAYKVESMTYDEPDYQARQRWIPRGEKDMSFFNAHYTAPTNGNNFPLLVFIHGGPHNIWTRAYSPTYEFALSLGMAVLVVNYRGSLGMGDETLSAIMGNIGDMGVEDVHQAVEDALQSRPELNGKVALCGHSYGSFISAHLAAKYPHRYNVVVAKSPLFDLSELRNAPRYVKELLGLNATMPIVLDKDMIATAFARSPINYIEDIEAKTLIFAGELDRETLPESQAIPFQKALLERNVTTQLYIYPNEGHAIKSLKATHHMLTKFILWVHEHWGTYHPECHYEAPTTTSRPDPTSTADNTIPGTTTEDNPAQRLWFQYKYL
ncbi:acylamino-acid-releasing enzyme-like isoform X2 [Tigriopus californicus]|uniref:acylamino-acid-releasing enzyme-like isoform X2 n=1 Tax=Tigriopus californicus TaxID=6832 RepID=UPI0027D9E3A1|nr:acylamino-acid-releasing enzyme-like isoform X2 [Tigriopus californicus]